MPSHYGKNPDVKNVNSSSMKPKPKPKSEKPVMKPKKDLSKRQKDLMKEHKEHHTPAHMRMMRKLMKEGFCFEQAHEMTMRKIGK